MAKKILLVEDGLFIRELYVHSLQKAGFEVTQAVDGEEGISFSESSPDLILLDIMLPKVTGIDVLKKLKANPATKNIPVVILTNLGEETVIKEAFNLGASGYLMKVRLTPSEMVEQIKVFLDNPNYKMSYKE